jgi:hypothetical protein
VKNPHAGVLFPDYYTRLAKMEAEAEAEANGNAQSE